MKDFKKSIIAPENTLKEALERITETAVQILLVVDHDERLIGTVTDGDLRKAVLKGLGHETPLTQVMNPKPITITQDVTAHEAIRLMQQRDIRYLPVVNPEGKILDLYSFKDLLASPTHGVKAVLMAGGRGTRLRPLTYEIPKPMIKLADQPVLEIIIQQLMTFGIDHIFISTNYLGEMIQNYFKDGSQLGCKIQYIEEPKELGTVGSIKIASKQFTEPFIVMNSDILTKCPMNRLYEFHQAQGNTLTVAVKKYLNRVPYGVVEIDPTSQVKSLIEKPSREYLINSGIYIISPECLQHIPEDTQFDMTDLINNLLESGQKVGAYPFDAYWTDIGNINDYERANQDIIAGTFSSSNQK